MPFIVDEVQSLPAQLPPPQTQVNYLNSSATVPSAGYAVSNAATCSCVRDANGAVVRACTTASYIPQVVVPPQQSPAIQSGYLVGMGGQFNDK